MKSVTFLQNIIFPSKYPPYLLFFVTSRCNQQCKHCFYWQKLNSYKDELSVEEIEKISKSLPNLFFVRVTGGEPFLRGDLYQIIEFLYKNSSVRRVGISTNGFFTNEITNITEQIVSNMKDLLFEVGISIDQIDEKHDEIRSCPAAFRNAMNTYDELKKIRDRRNNLYLGFLITMMKDNQNDLKQIFEYLHSKRPDGIGLNIIRGSPRYIEESDIDIEKYNDFVKLLNEYNISNLENSSFIERLRIVKAMQSQDIIEKVIRNKRAEITCLAADKIAVLYPNGDVCACEMLDGSIGNIRDYNYDFQQLWQSSKRREIIHRIRRSSCFCTHECFITASLIFRINRFLSIFTNTCLQSLRLLKKASNLVKENG